MDPAVVVALLQILANEGPKVYKAAKALATNPNPTPAMWDALDASLDETGEQLVPKRPS